MDKDQRTLQDATEALTALTGLHLTLEETPRTPPVEHALAVYVDGHRYTFGVLVKRTLTKSRASMLLQEVQGHPHLLVVTERVSSTVGALFREHGVAYLDTAGNSSIQAGSLYVLVEGRKGSRRMEPEPIRAFQEAGLRLLFLLLLDPEKVRCTYRDLSDMAGIWRGAVGYVLTDLMDLGYVVEVDNGQRRLLRREDLLKKWVSGYGETLRPKLVRGRFRFEDVDQRRDWRRLSLSEIDGLWGGEPAADLLTHYLRPVRFTIYTDAATTALVQATRLVPDPEGAVDVLSPFWDPDTLAAYLPPVDPPTVPSLLVYADLVASAASRNLEAARMLYDKELVA